MTTPHEKLSNESAAFDSRKSDSSAGGKVTTPSAGPKPAQK